VASKFLEWETTDHLTLRLAKAKIDKCLACCASVCCEPVNISIGTGREPGADALP